MHESVRQMSEWHDDGYDRHDPGPPVRPSTPRRVRAFAVAAIAVGVLVVVVLLLGGGAGGQGSGRHQTGDQNPSDASSPAIEGEARSTPVKGPPKPVLVPRPPPIQQREAAATEHVIARSVRSPLRHAGGQARS